MNISIAIIKTLSIITIIIISSFIVLGFLNAYNTVNSNKVENIDPITAKKIFKEILNDIYLTNNQEYIKVINLEKLNIKIQQIKLLFSIKLPNETLSWNLNHTILCFSNSCEIDYDSLYSIGPQPVREANLTLIPTLNIQFNTTKFSGINVYNFFITTLRSNYEGLLSGEKSIKIESHKNNLLITRTYYKSFMLYFFINNQQIYSQQIPDKTIINFYLTGIKISFLIINS